MQLKELTLVGFKSFAKKTELDFTAPITAIVGPNGSGKSNVAEAFRFVLGEQSMKSMRSKKGEDLIWGGSDATARSGRASIALTLENRDRMIDIDFDEVILERTVHRDGVNEYKVNGSAVRLRDVIELLGSANIGATGHHIISQGEADRILTASAKERREMLEDALGLKVYQFKKTESEKKLAKTRENIAHVEALRKEIQPHLRFLSKQVEKLQKAETLRKELIDMLRTYLADEEAYIQERSTHIRKEREGPAEELRLVEEQLQKANSELSEKDGADEKSNALIAIQKSLHEVRGEKNSTLRALGTLEGKLSAQEALLGAEDARTISLKEFRFLQKNLQELLLGALEKNSIEEMKDALRSIQETLDSFANELGGEEDQLSSALDTIRKEVEEETKSLETLSKKEADLEHSYQALEREIANEKDKERTAEREVFRLTAEQTKLQATLTRLASEEASLTQRKTRFEEAIRDALALVGSSVSEYKKQEGNVNKDEAEHEKQRTEIERMKIRLEELGGAGAEEIITEHREVAGRDAYLLGEVEDLEHSAGALEDLITELEERLAVQFSEGLQKINKEFEEFFSIMFGGGRARLSLVLKKKVKRGVEEEGEGEVEVEEGVAIEVSLPKKRIKGLEMLSGGERALTSIALIFAMSQVNPPPFLILDETDAALDEANSRRYGEMIRNLSKKSQLILITHNRETMSHAGVLYGVTMTGDGVSKLLSVKFEEAVQVAK